MEYKYLDQINFPEDLRKFKVKELNFIARELRSKTIDVVSKTGGHLGAGLGVIELTIALHYIFNTPKDKLIWDVGHQAYPHKILTGRKHKIETLRQENGLYGFVKRSESEYDTFGTAHSSTSISACLGIYIVWRKLFFKISINLSNPAAKPRIDVSSRGLLNTLRIENCLNRSAVIL